MANLPFEIVAYEIFTRLSAKDVGRLKVLSKRWYFELSSQKFATMHFTRLSMFEKQKFLTNQGSSFAIFNTNSGQHHAYLINIIPFPIQTMFSDIQVLSSLNGLLLVCEKNTALLILWNPTTRVYKVVSDCHSGNYYNYQLDAASLYVDSSNDYKILLLKRDHGLMRPFVYSRRYAAWRSIGFLTETKYNGSDYVWSSGTFCKSSLFFTVSKYWSECESFVVKFDVDQETFSKISFPYVQKSWIAQGHLLKISNVLHMFLTNGFPNFGVDLWKLDTNIWTRVLSFQHVRQAGDVQQCDVAHVLNEHTWILNAEWGQTIKVFMDAVQLGYLDDADTFRGVRGALFYESLISPFV